MKKAVIILMLICLAFSYGCQNEKKETRLSTFDFQNEYSITELEDFFGKLPTNEQLQYSDFNVDNITKKEVLNKFPAEYTGNVSKWSGAPPHFVIYKVKEGGYYYVFFNIGSPTLEESYVGFTAHLTKLCKKSDFGSIKAGKSTAYDVAQIDPAMELTFMMSSGIYSMSLLDNGNIFVVKYKQVEKEEISRNALVLEKTFGYKNFAGCWGSVSRDDLP